MTKKTITIASVIIIFVSVFAAYSSALRNGFVWDDEALIVQNQLIKNWGNAGRLFLTHLFGGTATASNFYRPLQALSYMLDYSVWELRPFGYHLTNILVHALNSILLYILFKRLTDKRASLIATLLFAVHPVHTEAVAYISGRADLLGFMFMILCSIFFLDYKYALSATCYILALLCKETGIIAPLIIFWLLVALKKDMFKNRSRVVAVALLVFSPIAVVYAILRLTVLKFPFYAFLTESQPLIFRILTMLKVIPIYLRLLILPLRLHMDRHIPIVRSVMDTGVIAGFFIVIAAWYLAFRLKDKSRLYLFSLGWFFIAFLPVSNIIPLNVTMAEHWLYFPSVGLFLLAGYGFQRWIWENKLNYAGLIVFLSIFFAFVGLTLRQNTVWSSERLLYESTLKYSEGTYLVHSNLGEIFQNDGDIEGAIKEYKKSIELNKYYTVPRQNLALIYASRGRFKEAISNMEEAIRYYPIEAENYYVLGIIYEHNSDGQRYGAGSDLEAAKKCYEKASEFDPKHYYAHFNLAVACEFDADGRRYSPKSDLKRAEKEYAAALAINPNMDKAYTNLEILRKYLSSSQ